ncbi:carnosine N-methyltransferase-like [Teratosphaeria destructans]|uniref:carnosine N-methyltransferase n=1 Tax=Teratosphaeria destructans TaxID=418781 RepID=A0A9W7SL44_9PEZI|nr:carnosine N-methyltransferase-like [Teratosphaeria destructans]
MGPSDASPIQHSQDDMEFDPMEDPEERRVLHAALDSFRQYRQAAHYNITHLRRQAFYSLPTAHMEILSEPPFSLPKTFDAVDEAIDANAELAEAILVAGLPAFGIPDGDNSWHGQATPSDMDKARSTLRQFYRDWSAEAADERSASYEPIYKALEGHLPAIDPSRRHQQSLLVPGAGLGRLVIELCSRGYSVEGNEISYHQLLASSYILNFTRQAGQHTLYPWALAFSNHLTRANQLQSVAVPDVHPGTELEARSQALQSEVHCSERLSMSAGDFCEIYRREENEDTFDAVVTCFFIDTAPNFLRYLETIKTCLKPGGLWVNLGPLLWHFEAAPTPAEQERARRQNGAPAEHQVRAAAASSSEGIGEPGSFELSNDEVLALVQRLGFELLEHRQEPAGPAGYIQDAQSMLQSSYRPSFWVAKLKV